MHIKYYLFFIRKYERKISIRKLSRLSGVNKNYISQIENGKVHPNLVVICKLANALNVSSYALFDVKPD